MLLLFLNIVFFIYVVLFFEILGNLIAKKIFNKTFSCNLVFGFIAYISIFQLLTMLPMILHFQFTPVKYFILIVTIFISIFIFIKNGRETISNLLENKKYLYIYLTSIIVFSIYVMYQSISVSDSWIYMPLTLSSIQNNVIFSNSGNGLLELFNSNHALDSYYLFQSILASVSKMDPYLYLMTIFRAIEVTIIFSSFAILFEVIFKKRKKYILYLVCSSLIFSVSLLTPYVTFFEIDFLFMNIMSTGALLLNTVFVSFLFIYYYIRNEKTNNLLYMFVMSLCGLALTSSATYVILFYLIILVIIDIFINRTSEYIKYYIIPFYIISIYFSVFFLLKDKNYFLFVIVLFFLTVIFGWFYRLFNKLSFKKIKCIIEIFLVAYFSFILFMFIRNITTYDLINNIFNLEFSRNYTVNSAYYFNFFSSIFVLLFFVLGIIKVFITNKKFFIYFIVSIFFVANIFIYNSFGALIGREGFHRVFVLSMMNIIMIYGFIYLFEIFSKYTNVKVKHFFIVTPLIFLVFSGINLRGDYNNFDNFTAYKLGNNNIYQLYKFNFEFSNSMSISSISSSVSHLEQNVSMIFQYRTDLQILPFCKSDCYELYNKDVEYDGKLVLETQDYILVYKEKNEE